ncbi:MULTISPECIES: DUF6421 family protein [unclassified Streptomyces]|uniref:DUF6421 family protein n=1 Tax=unclassified Streptomyces TaxID=2593676 RepID=UPI002DD9E325|nr:DUF6421 family protein [Streptomyces sp. NBC_01237]WRZ72261.1 DUF6421 family protein [Streptomyces sp. NBC_01237]
MNDVIDAVNVLRGSVRRDERRDEASLKRLARGLLASPVLRKVPIVQVFAEDVLTFAEDPRLLRTKAHINTRVDNHIFSLFDASYFPTLSLDFLSYRTSPTDTHLDTGYPSPTMPVTIERMSKGFEARPVVALFPENHIDGRQESGDLVFYFIDKFVERHLRLTRLLVHNVMAEGSFPLVEAAGPEDIAQASSWWVRLHEYHHRQGDMPIPDFLPVKKLKPLAGLEELRVDVSAMLACLHDSALPERGARLTYEYVLSERLLRYAVEGIPRPNYDAVASQLLFNYLIAADGIRLHNGLIHLRPGLPAVLAEFLGEIQAIEGRIHSEPAEQVQERLLRFTNQYTDYDEKAKDYQHILFFAEAKRKLGV